MKYIPAFICCALAAGCAPDKDAEQGVTNMTAPNEEAQRLEKVPLVIHHGENAPDQRIEVEIALTRAQQEMGLQHRRTLRSGEGMIFPMVPPRLANFWMKDTSVSLDIIFIRTDGSIAKIERGAKPGDRTPVFAEVPVSGVLELPAGDVAAMAIDEGDHINWGTCIDDPPLKAGTVDKLNFCPAST